MPKATKPEPVLALSDSPTGGESKNRKVTDPERSRMVRVRYAPSPTGVPHIGNIRTALFNYLFAKNQGGQFLLRIEDTDRTRLVPEAIDKIKQSLNLLGLNFDEEEIYQSKRLDIYHKHLEILKEKGLAYEDEGAWRFKVEKGQTLSWDDAVHGKVEFKSEVVEDFVIIKSDSYPTYHFANVIDDHETQISHVFRGDEWIPSTPKHLMLYQAFGWEHPAFVHLPPILGPDHKKLSKRDGAKSAMEYIEEGYLPEAIINFMAFLGWAPKDNREIFSLEELAKEFSLDRINKNSPIFNIEKLNWFNGQWIRQIPDEDLADRIVQESPQFSKEKVTEILPIAKDRLVTLKDFNKIAGFILNDDIEVDISLVKLEPDKLNFFYEAFGGINDWNKANISSAAASVMSDQGLTKAEALGSIGASISGSTVTPPLFDSLEKLGKEKTLIRLENVIKKQK